MRLPLGSATHANKASLETKKMGTWGVLFIMACILLGLFIIRHYRYQAAGKNKAKIDPKDTWMDAEVAAGAQRAHQTAANTPQFLQQQLPARNLAYVGSTQSSLRQRGAIYETPAMPAQFAAPSYAATGVHHGAARPNHSPSIMQYAPHVAAPGPWQQFRAPGAAARSGHSSATDQAALPRPGRRAPLRQTFQTAHDQPVNRGVAFQPAPFSPPPAAAALAPAAARPASSSAQGDTAIPAAVHRSPGQVQGGHAYYGAQNAAMPLHVAAAQAAASSHFAAAASEARLPSADTEIKYSALSLGQLVGQGAFGRVYSGKWRGSPVAVKVLAVPSLTPELVKEFRGEAQLMATLRHPNVVLFMGVCTAAPNYAIVTEYMPRGSLWGVLHANEGASGGGSSAAGGSLDAWKPESPGLLPWALVLQMAVQAARGLAFLHSAQPPILHRDLKSGNLLVGDAWCIKLTDFGLSRVRGYAATMTGQVGTCQWMANEVLAQARYTEAADVFSFGIVLWELVTRECPYAHLPSSVQVAVAVLKDGLRPAVPPGVPSALGSLMQACWHAEASRRPDMATVLQQLEAMK